MRCWFRITKCSAGPTRPAHGRTGSRATAVVGIGCLLLLAASCRSFAQLPCASSVTQRSAHGSSDARPIDWYDEYNTRWPDGFSPGSTLPWSETYIIRSFISMYRAAKARGESPAEQQKWIDRLLLHCDAVVASAAMTSEGKAYLVGAGHGFTPVARFARMIFQDDALYARYKDKANAYLRHLETEIIPYWRDPLRASDWRLTPYNWYLSFGSLLMHLQQVARSPRYRPPQYRTPDTALSRYYSDFLNDIAATGFRDFGNWTCASSAWQWANTVAPTVGLCYCPAPRDAYVWRYFDVSDNLVFSGNHAEIACAQPLRSDTWYHLVVTRANDTIRIRCHDSTAQTLLFEQAAPWKAAPLAADLFIGRRLDAPSSAYFEGIIDELTIRKDGALTARWPFDSSADDVSGNGHHATVHGSPRYAPGKVGTGMQFRYDYLVVPHHADFDAFTEISFWMKLSETSPKYYNYLLGKGAGFPDSTGFHLYVSSYKRPEDIGHANLDVEFALKAARDSLCAPAFPTTLLARLGNSFTRILWSNGDSLHPAFRSHLHPDSTYGSADCDEHTFRWLWLYEINPLIGTLVSNWYVDHPSARMNEAVANLACWQAGLHEDDDESDPAAIAGPPASAAAPCSIYPNPSRDHCVIRVGGEVAADVIVYDVFGHEIRSLRGNGMVTWDGRDRNSTPVPRGCYMLVIRTASITTTRLVIRD
jgi:hypothetical protein